MSVEKPYRITLHWTAGGLKSNAVDRKAYHYIIEDDGRVIHGVHTPEANNNTADWHYARHCAGGNTGNIGVAVAGGPLGHKHGVITPVAIEAMCALVAKLCKTYGIKITSDTVCTHAEFDRKQAKPQGKRDFDWLPHEGPQHPSAVGDMLRRKIRWYFDRLSTPPVPEATISPIPDDGATPEVF
jgi:N-acetyl-anhydromuramyl-L-alanine amidase AmpD